MKANRLFFRLLLFAVAVGLTPGLHAQVTVGEEAYPLSFSLLELSTKEVKGGLRLPHITAVQRDSIAASDGFAASQKAQGLVIFNTTNNCLEYWNRSRWVSLCQGQTDITFADEADNTVDPTEPAVPWEGEDRGPFTPHDQPDCTGQNPAYGFVVMTGGEYVHIEVINPSTGQFRISFDLNPTAVSRTAIVRIINNCTQEYKEFLFSQAGDDDDCDTQTVVPQIQSYNSGNSTVMCTGGAVYLYISGTFS
jgi:hypothetical protein